MVENMYNQAMNSPITCPLDGKDDAIQKVSGITKAGTQRGSYSGPTGGVVYGEGKSRSYSGYSTLSGITQTDLASLLSPPFEPGKSEYYGRLALVVILGFLGFGMFCPSLLIYLGLGLTLVTFRLAEFLSSPYPDIENICVAFLMPIFIIYFIKVRRKRNQLLKESEASYRIDLPAWETAMSKWQRSYYCYRHDIVFDPETAETSSPQEFEEFLYR